jgi:hypothetical protein
MTAASMISLRGLLGPHWTDTTSQAPASPDPYPGPVFIHDIYTSWGSRPMILYMWDEWARARDGETDPPSEP